MKKVFLALVAALALSGVSAQQSFPDIPAGHWAGDAVSRIADLGIVTGFPDGTFRGNESFTRYQAALVISRLLDVINENSQSGMSEEDMAAINGAMGELTSELDSLGARVTALEDNQAEVDSLRSQVEALTAELDTLRAQVEAGGLEGPPGPAGPAGPAGPPGPAGEVPDVEVEAPEAPDVEVVEPEVIDTPDVIDEPVAEADRGKFSVRLGALASFVPADVVTDESDIFVPARFAVGYDDILFGLGLRVGADYNRFAGALGEADNSSVAISGHLTYNFDFTRRLGAYAGVGGGYELGLGSLEVDGAFAGGLVGAEYLLFGGLGVFVEGGADYYFNDVGVLPTVGGGIVYRF